LDNNGKPIINQYRPAHIKELKNIVSVAAGSDFALAVDKDGDVYGWGAGQQSQLGRRLLDRHRFKALVPNRLALPRKSVTHIYAGANHAFAIDKNGNTWAWGSNNFGQTGITTHAGEDNSIVTAPTQVPSLQNMKMLAGGNHHSIGIDSDDNALVWGRMDSGQIGIDKSLLPVDDDTQVLKNARGQPAILLQPAMVPNLKAKVVAAGSEHCLVATPEGKVWSWGFGTSYQTGQGTVESIEVARLIDNTALRERKVSWVGGGGQYSVFAAPAPSA
jgi:regulator of chromosome condensation